MSGSLRSSAIVSDQANESDIPIFSWIWFNCRPSPIVTDLLRTSHISGPARTRTEDQGIHSAPPFPEGVDYLFTHVGCGTL